MNTEPMAGREKLISHPLSKHSHTEDHQINWSQAKLITSIKHWYPRRIREAIKIIKHNTVPQDIGFNISDIWRPILTPQSNGSPIP